MENELGRKIIEIDARPSDSMVLALQQKRPVFVAKHPPGQEPRYRTILSFWNVAPANRLEIAPHSVAVHQNTVVLPAPARIESFQPHMHMRGKAMSMEMAAARVCG
jgi:hypothetical protein